MNICLSLNKTFVTKFEFFRTSNFRGRESIFRVKDSEGFSVPRRPDLPRFQPRRGRASEGQVTSQPRKYIKYTLADVDDLSDKGNARVAFDFLRKKREEKIQIRESEGADDEDESAKKKITFKRPVKKQVEEEGEVKVDKVSGGMGGFGKRVLPECVVGAPPKFGRQKRELRKIEEVAETDPESKKLKTSDEGDETASTSKKKSKSSVPKLSFQFGDEDDEEDQ